MKKLDTKICDYCEHRQLSVTAWWCGRTEWYCDLVLNTYEKPSLSTIGAHVKNGGFEYSKHFKIPKCCPYL